MSKKLFVFTLLVCLSAYTNAQTSYIVDSLELALQQVEGDSARVMLKTQLAREYIYVDISKANDLAQEALDLAEEKELELEKAYAMRVMGAVLRQSGFYLQGAEMLLNAQNIFREYNDLLGVANCNMSLSHVYDVLRDHRLSLRVSFEALEIYQSLRNQERIGVIYNNIGRTYYDIGKLDSSELYTRKSIAINKKVINYPLLESNYRNIGLLLIKRDQLDSAKHYFEKVLTLHKSLGEQSNTWATAESYMSLAHIAFEQKEFEKIPDYLDKSATLASSYGYLDVLKQVMQIAFRYYREVNDQSGLDNAWNEYKSITDSLIKFERENKKDIVEWYEERLQKELEIRTINTQIGKQRTQIIALAIIVGLSLAILVMFFNNNRKGRQVNRILNEQKEELERLNETKNKLFSIVAHDFRGPVGQVYAFSSLLEKHIESFDPQELKKVAVDMNKSVKNTLTLTENLLSWAKNQMDGVSSKPRQFDLSDVLNKVVETHIDQAERKAIKLEGKFEKDLKIFADPEELEVVFRNLLTNAIKFSSLEDKVVIEGQRQNGHVVVRVCDEGLGMDQETKSTLFDISKKSGIKGTAGELGTGLGLVVCKEFIEQNRGSIHVQSEKDKGSVFTVKFPYSNEAT